MGRYMFNEIDMGGNAQCSAFYRLKSHHFIYHVALSGTPFVSSVEPVFYNNGGFWSGLLLFKFSSLQ